jgi:hypothetical protein
VCRLSSFPHNEDAFVWYCARYPRVHERVNACLSTLEQVMERASLADLVAGRDAALQLAMIAREGGFLLLADFFSVQYDRFCRALLPFFIDTPS